MYKLKKKVLVDQQMADQQEKMHKEKLISSLNGVIFKGKLGNVVALFFS